MNGEASPAKFAVAVTPSDVTNLGSPARSLYIGTTGNIAVVMAGNDAVVTFSNVPVGILPVQVKRVNSTNTTASNIVAMW